LIAGSIGVGVMIYMVCKKFCVHGLEKRTRNFDPNAPFTVIEISYTN
jgi:hypothetical protein